MKQFDRRFEEDNVAEQMISVQPSETDVQEIDYKKPESKTKKITLLVKPTLYARMKNRQAREYVSINEQINQAIEIMLKEKGY